MNSHLDDVLHLHCNHDHERVPGPHHGPVLHSDLLNDPGHRSYSVPETTSTPGSALVFGHGLLKLPGALPGQGELEGGRETGLSSELNFHIYI